MDTDGVLGRGEADGVGEGSSDIDDRGERTSVVDSERAAQYPTPGLRCLSRRVAEA